MSDDAKREGKAKTPQQQMESLIDFIDCYVQALRDDYAHSPPAEGIATLLAVKAGAIEALSRLPPSEHDGREGCRRRFAEKTETLRGLLRNETGRAGAGLLTEENAKAVAALVEAQLAVLRAEHDVGLAGGEGW